MFKCSVKLPLILLIFFAAVPAAAIPQLWNIPVESSKFIGREKYLLKISQQLPQNPVVLSGLSGIGKTSLAYHYVRCHYAEYDIAWKFDAAKDLDDQVTKLAQKLCELEDLVKTPRFSDPIACLSFVKSWLRQTKRRWLLIFDDAKSYGDIVGYLPEIHGNKDKHIIVTSLSIRARELSMRLEKFSEEESLAFLKFHLGDAFEKEACLTLAEIVDFHPLALRQAVSFIKFTPGFSIKDYIELFKNKTQEFWEMERAALANDNFRSNQPELYTSIKISLEKLKKERPDSYRLLTFLVQVYHKKIEGKLIRSWLDRFTQKNLTAFGSLLDRALVFKIEESDTSKGYAIHNYVRDVVLDNVTDAELLEAQNSSIDLFHHFLSGNPDIVFEYFESHPNHINHLEALCALRKDINSDKDLDLAVKLLYYSYYVQRKYDFSEVLARKISTSLQNKSFGNKLIVASFYSMNSYMKYLSDGLPEAIEEALKASRLLKTMDSEEVRKELIMLLSNNLGFYYYWRLCCKKFRELQNY